MRKGQGTVVHFPNDRPTSGLNGARKLPAFLRGAPIEVRTTNHRPELAAALELVYRNYLARGYIRPQPGGIVYRPSFGLPSTRTIIALAMTGQVAGTLTLVGDNPHGFQLEESYALEVRELRRQGLNLSEVTALAVDRRDDVTTTGVYFGLTHFMLQYAQWSGIDRLLIAVHPKHARFYERWFGAEPFGPCRRHPSVQMHPAVGYQIDLRGIERRVDATVRVHYSEHPIPASRFAGSAIDHDDHLYFCCRAGIDPAEVRNAA